MGPQLDHGVRVRPRPQKYDTNGLYPPGTLSKADKDWVRKWYPPVKARPNVLKAFESVSLDLETGEQADFLLQPNESRKFTMTTKGASDTLLVLFEEVSGKPRYLTADDDSGEDRNATIVHKLFKGRTYHLRLRLYYPGQSGTTSIMYF
jgi:hypothetical protein